MSSLSEEEIVDATTTGTSATTDNNATSAFSSCNNNKEEEDIIAVVETEAKAAETGNSDNEHYVQHHQIQEDELIRMQEIDKTLAMQSDSLTTLRQSMKADQEDLKNLQTMFTRLASPIRKDTTTPTPTNIAASASTHVGVSEDAGAEEEENRKRVELEQIRAAKEAEEEEDRKRVELDKILAAEKESAEALAGKSVSTSIPTTATTSINSSSSPSSKTTANTSETGTTGVSPTTAAAKSKKNAYAMALESQKNIASEKVLTQRRATLTEFGIASSSDGNISSSFGVGLVRQRIGQWEGLVMQKAASRSMLDILLKRAKMMALKNRDIRMSRGLTLNELKLNEDPNAAQNASGAARRASAVAEGTVVTESNSFANNPFLLKQGLRRQSVTVSSSSGGSSNNNNALSGQGGFNPINSEEFPEMYSLGSVAMYNLTDLPTKTQSTMMAVVEARSRDIASGLSLPVGVVILGNNEGGEKGKSDARMASVSAVAMLLQAEDNEVLMAITIEVPAALNDVLLKVAVFSKESDEEPAFVRVYKMTSSSSTTDSQQLKNSPLTNVKTGGGGDLSLPPSPPASSSSTSSETEEATTEKKLEIESETPTKPVAEEEKEEDGGNLSNDSETSSGSVKKIGSKFIIESSLESPSSAASTSGGSHSTFLNAIPNPELLNLSADDVMKGELSVAEAAARLARLEEDAGGIGDPITRIATTARKRGEGGGEKGVGSRSNGTESLSANGSHDDNDENDNDNYENSKKGTVVVSSAATSSDPDPSSVESDIDPNPFDSSPPAAPYQLNSLNLTTSQDLSSSAPTTPISRKIEKDNIDVNGDSSYIESPYPSNGISTWKHVFTPDIDLGSAMKMKMKKESMTDSSFHESNDHIDSNPEATPGLLPTASRMTSNSSNNSSSSSSSSNSSNGNDSGSSDNIEEANGLLPTTSSSVDGLRMSALSIEDGDDDAFDEDDNLINKSLENSIIELNSKLDSALSSSSSSSSSTNVKLSPPSATNDKVHESSEVDDKDQSEIPEVLRKEDEEDIDDDDSSLASNMNSPQLFNGGRMLSVATSTHTRFDPLSVNSQGGGGVDISPAVASSSSGGDSSKDARLAKKQDSWTLADERDYDLPAAAQTRHTLDISGVGAITSSASCVILQFKESSHNVEDAIDSDDDDDDVEQGSHYKSNHSQHHKRGVIVISGTLKMAEIPDRRSIISHDFIFEWSRGVAVSGWMRKWPLKSEKNSFGRATSQFCILRNDELTFYDQVPKKESDMVEFDDNRVDCFRLSNNTRVTTGRKMLRSCMSIENQNDTLWARVPKSKNIKCTETIWMAALKNAVRQKNRRIYFASKMRVESKWFHESDTFECVAVDSYVHSAHGDGQYVHVALFKLAFSLPPKVATVDKSERRQSWLGGALALGAKVDLKSIEDDKSQDHLPSDDRDEFNNNSFANVTYSLDIGTSEGTKIQLEVINKTMSLNMQSNISIIKLFENSNFMAVGGSNGYLGVGVIGLARNSALSPDKSGQSAAAAAAAGTSVPPLRPVLHVNRISPLEKRQTIFTYTHSSRASITAISTCSLLTKTEVRGSSGLVGHRIEKAYYMLAGDDEGFLSLWRISVAPKSVPSTVVSASEISQSGLEASSFADDHPVVSLVDFVSVNCFNKKAKVEENDDGRGDGDGVDRDSVPTSRDVKPEGIKSLQFLPNQELFIVSTSRRLLLVSLNDGYLNFDSSGLGSKGIDGGQEDDLAPYPPSPSDVPVTPTSVKFTGRGVGTLLKPDLATSPSNYSNNKSGFGDENDPSSAAFLTPVRRRNNSSSSSSDLANDNQLQDSDEQAAHLPAISVNATPSVYITQNMSLYMNSPWNQFVEFGRNILLTSNLGKYNPLGLIQNRQLILTDKPSLLYVDASKMQAKGEILWDIDNPPVASRINAGSFAINCPNTKRNYKFALKKDVSVSVDAWVNGINEVAQRTNKKSLPVSTSVTAPLISENQASTSILSTSSSNKTTNEERSLVITGFSCFSELDKVPSEFIALWSVSFQEALELEARKGSLIVWKMIMEEPNSPVKTCDVYRFEWNDDMINAVVSRMRSNNR